MHFLSDCPSVTQPSHAGHLLPRTPTSVAQCGIRNLEHKKICFYNLTAWSSGRSSADDKVVVQCPRARVACDLVQIPALWFHALQ